MAETKANPGASSCYRKALPDEPMFVLLARDRCAPDAIRAWADDRTKRAIEEDWSENAERISDALETADIMERWRTEHDGSWRNHRPDPDVIPTPCDEIASIAGRILARRPTDEVPVCGEKFDTLLADAKRLAGFVLNADPQPGPNRG